MKAHDLNNSIRESISNFNQLLFKRREKEDYNFELHGKKYKFAEESIYLFHYEDGFRQGIASFVESRLFNIFMNIIIVASICSLPLYDYSERRGYINKSDLHKIYLPNLDLFFSLVFIFEFLLKIIEMGFIMEEGTYLRKGDNWIYFIITLSCFFSLIPGLKQYRSFLRLFRVMNLIKILYQVKEVKIIMVSFIRAVPSLATIMMFLTFITFIYAIAGLQLFNTVFYQRCRIIEIFPLNEHWQADNSISSLCNIDNNQCPEDLWCGIPAVFNNNKRLQDELNNVDLNFGATTFDNIFKSLFTISQVLVAESWVFLGNVMITAYNPIYIYAYFISLSLLGSYYVLNLILAVFTDNFEDTQQMEWQDDFEEWQQQAEQLGENENQLIMLPGFSWPVYKVNKDIIQQKLYMNMIENQRQVQIDNQQNQEITLHGIRKSLSNIINSVKFQLLINACIITNIVFLAFDRYPITQSEVDFNEFINIIFTFVFAFELLISIAVMGFKQYFRDKLNIFDSIIVVITLLDAILFLTLPQIEYKKFPFSSVFKAFRILRMIKLARLFESIRYLLEAISKTLYSISQFILVLALFYLGFALIGQELYGYSIKIDEDNRIVENNPASEGDSPRVNFDQFSNSIISTFILSTGEVWQDTMFLYFQGMRSWWPAIYFFLVKIIGKFIVLKLYLAILIDKFLQVQEENLILKQVMNQNPLDLIKDIQKRVTKVLNQAELLKLQQQQSQQNLSLQNLDQQQDDVNSKSENSEQAEKKNFDEQKKSKLLFEPDHLQIDKIKDWYKKKDKIELEGISLNYFNQDHKVRKFCFKTINSNIFSIIALFAVAAATLAIILESPLENPNTDTNKLVFRLNLVSTIFFFCEIIIKIIALGFVQNGEYSYLRQLRNILELTVALVAFLDLLPWNLSSYKVFKILRTLRILRPLIILSKIESLKMAINSIITSLPHVTLLMLICLFTFIIFGIFGISFLKGTYYYCINCDSIDQVNTKTECFDFGGDWVNQEFNFDNIFKSLSTLFTFSLADGWSDIMWSGIDANGIDKQPKTDNNHLWAIFFIFFLNVSNFFLLNLFAGVIVDSFAEQRDHDTGFIFLTPLEKDWVNTQIRCVDAQPEYVYIEKKGDGQFKKWIYQIIQNPYFDRFINLCVVLNVIVFTLRWVGQDRELKHFLNQVNMVFLIIFTVESFLKIIIMKNVYFKYGYNSFDCVVIILTWIGITLEYLKIIQNMGSLSSILRIFRILKILSNIKKVKTLGTLFQTFVHALPPLGNIIIIFIVILFVFSIIGRDFFAFVMFKDDGLSSSINFTSFGKSCYALYIAATGQGYSNIYIGVVAQRQPNYACLDIKNYQDYIQYGLNGCGSNFGYIFMIVFELLSQFIVLNLILTFILDGYTSIQEYKDSYVKPDNIDQFIEIWKIYDPDATGYISVKYLQKILSQVASPLGWRDQKEKKLKSFKRFALRQLNLPIYQPIKKDLQQGYYFCFYDILEVLTKSAYYYKYNIKQIMNEKVFFNIMKKKVNKRREYKTEYIMSDLTYRQYLNISKFIRHMKHFWNQKKSNLIELSSQDSLQDTRQKKNKSINVVAPIGSGAKLIYNLNLQ